MEKIGNLTLPAMKLEVHKCRIVGEQQKLTNPDVEESHSHLEVVSSPDLTVTSVNPVVEGESTTNDTSHEDARETDEIIPGKDEDFCGVKSQ